MTNPAELSQDHTLILHRYRQETMAARLVHERHILESAAINYHKQAAEGQKALYEGISMALLGIVATGVVAASSTTVHLSHAPKIAAAKRGQDVSLALYRANAAGPGSVQNASRAYAAAIASRNVHLTFTELAKPFAGLTLASHGICQFLVEGGDASGPAANLLKESFGLMSGVSLAAQVLLEIGLAYTESLHRRQLIFGNSTSASNSVAHFSGQILKQQLERTYRKYEEAINKASGTEFRAIMVN